MIVIAPRLTAVCATACRRSDERIAESKDEANAWLEGVRSGARSKDKECVTCGRGPPLQDNHIAGWKHGDLTVPQCLPCHSDFSEDQDLWDPRWQSRVRTLELDESLLLRGLVELLRIRAKHVPVAESGAYIAIAEALREQYVQCARMTL